MDEPLSLKPEGAIIETWNTNGLKVKYIARFQKMQSLKNKGTTRYNPSSWLRRVLGAFGMGN